jgi:hypothetical protein
MSNDNKGSQLLVVKENICFTEDEIQLRKLLKELDKASKEAVEILLECAKSRDDRVRLQAASKLIEFKIDVTDKINADKIQRMIAELKLNGKSSNGSLVPTSATPVVDFTKIRTIE